MPANSNKWLPKWRCRMKNKNLDAQIRDLEQTVDSNVPEILEA
jgi:hypothetical protein